MAGCFICAAIAMKLCVVFKDITLRIVINLFNDLIEIAPHVKKKDVWEGVF